MRIYSTYFFNVTCNVYSLIEQIDSNVLIVNIYLKDHLVYLSIEDHFTLI